MSLTAHSSLKSEEPKEKGYFKEGNNLDTLGDIYQGRLLYWWHID